MLVLVDFSHAFLCTLKSPRITTCKEGYSLFRWSNDWLCRATPLIVSKKIIKKAYIALSNAEEPFEDDLDKRIQFFDAIYHQIMFHFLPNTYFRSFSKG